MGSFSGGFEHYAPWKTIDGREVVTERARSSRCSSEGVFEPAAVPRPRPQLRRLQRRAARTGQAGREVPPVLGGQRRGRVDGRGRRPGRRPARWRRLAHPGLGQVLSRCCSTPRRSCATRAWATRRSSSSPTATTSTTSSSARCSRRPTDPARDSRCRPSPAPTCATLLDRASGGIIFTTIQKFAPEDASGDVNPVLTDRRNVVVMADEAHRSQYGFTSSIDGVQAAWPSTARRAARRHLPRLHRHPDRVERPSPPGRSSATTSTSTT